MAPVPLINGPRSPIVPTARNAAARWFRNPTYPCDEGRREPATDTPAFGGSKYKLIDCSSEFRWW